MQFMKKSEPYVKFAIKHFKKLKLDLDDKKRKKQNKLLKSLYASVQEADKNVSKLIKRGLDSNVSELLSANMFDSISLTSSKYFPEDIKTDIKNNATYKITYNITCLQIELSINFFVYDEIIHIKEYDEYVRLMLTWIYMAHQYSTTRCFTKLNINIFMSPFKKLLPNNSVTILGVDNANTAVTYSCYDPGEILIYRKEEWFKVFIHETFHSFGLDFSTMAADNLKKKMNRLYPINSTFDISETYAETWAEIINCVFKSFYSVKQNDLSLFLTYSEFLLQIERIFSLYQCYKILEYMGLSYENLYLDDDNNNIARDNLYKENTNIFAYYILKTVLLYDYIGFIEWCKTNNTSFVQFTKTEHNLNLFYEYIESNHDIPDLKLDLQTLSDLRASNIIKNTMRMSIVEII